MALERRYFNTKLEEHQWKHAETRLLDQKKARQRSTLLRWTVQISCHAAGGRASISQSRLQGIWGSYTPIWHTRSRTHLKKSHIIQRGVGEAICAHQQHQCQAQGALVCWYKPFFFNSYFMLLLWSMRGFMFMFLALVFFPKMSAFSWHLFKDL